MAKTIPAGLRYLQIFSCHGCQSCYEVSPDGESMEQFDHILSQTDITDELTGDDPEWIKKLRVELMMSKNTHNFDFSRDEVMELMRLNMKDAAHSYNQKQEIENLRAQVEYHKEVSQSTACQLADPEDALKAAQALAPWLSASLDDPKVCKEFKDAVNGWFNTGMPTSPKEPEAWTVP